MVTIVIKVKSPEQAMKCRKGILFLLNRKIITCPHCHQDFSRVVEVQPIENPFTQCVLEFPEAPVRIILVDRLYAKQTGYGDSLVCSAEEVLAQFTFAQGA